MGRIRLRVVSERETGVPELSAVAIANGRIYVADDELGVALLGPKGAKFGGAGELEGIEGLTADASGRCLYAVGENSRRLHRIAIAKDGSLSSEKELGKLPRPGSKKKGWEGAAWLGSGKGGRLLLAHENKPRCLGIVAPDDLDACEIVELPEELDDALDDLSDIAIEPKTGLVWILSDESSAIGIGELAKTKRGWTLEARDVLALPKKGLQSEGIVFDAQGRLLVASEEDGLLQTLAIVR